MAVGPTRSGVLSNCFNRLSPRDLSTRKGATTGFGSANKQVRWSTRNAGRYGSKARISFAEAARSGER
jgi:hypothetical protein